jgi:ribosomal protein L37AE/L43A
VEVPVRERAIAAVDEAPVAPTACPFCRSSTVSATGQKITASTYYRCEKCGQVWHPGRLRLTRDVEFPRR